MRDPEIQRLIDERQIYGVVARYCIGADRRDASMMRDCYWPEAIDDHGLTPALNAHEFVAMAAESPLMAMLPRTLHILGQVSCDIADNRARVESYVTAYQRVVNKPEVVELFFGKTYKDLYENEDCESHDFIVGGRYLDVFERRGDVWRILTRVATAEWERSGPASKVMSEGLFKDSHGPESDFRAPHII